MAAGLLAAAPAPSPVAADLLLAETPAPKLSDYRLFADAAATIPNARVAPYALNTPLFSDYAAKYRYVFVPAGQRIGYRADGVLDFPVGTALIKTFAYPADMRVSGSPERKLETRLLIRRASGWVALPYVWTADGSEAVLKRAGAQLQASWIDAAGAAQSVDWQVPNVNQCKGCHAAGHEITPIGPKAWNLGPARLDAFTRAGLMAKARGVPIVPAWDDASAPVALRARAYLDVNCAHCHNAKGPASNSGLFLERDQRDPVAAGIGKRPVAAGRGTGDREVAIAPGQPDASILLYRIHSTEPGVMMPELGRTLRHAEGEALVRRYIAEMN